MINGTCTAKTVERELSKNETRLAANSERLSRLRKRQQRLKKERATLLFQHHVLTTHTQQQIPFTIDDWRCLPLTSLRLHTIEGLGQIRLQTLIQLLPTIGDLEHYRVSVGINSLPGWSDTLRRKVEERLLSWLRLHVECYQPPRSADHYVARPIRKLAEEYISI